MDYICLKPVGCSDTVHAAALDAFGMFFIVCSISSCQIFFIVSGMLTNTWCARALCVGILYVFH